MKACSRFIHLLICFAIFGVGFVFPLSAEAEQRFDLSYFKLKNGLEVVILPNHRAPLALVQIYYKVGAADGPAGKNGIAHFLEHLLFKGTKKFPDFDDQIELRGGSNNATTNQDVTVYYEMMAKEYLPLMLELEADRMVNIQLTDQVVLPERDVILEERRQRIDNSPEAQLGEALDTVLYLNHPYRLPIIGWEHEIAGLTTKDALDFYQTHYAPNNAVLIISGDVKPEEAKPMVEKFFGPLEARNVPPRQRLQEPPREASASIEFRSKLVELPGFNRTYIAPSYRTAKSNDAYALTLLSEIWDGTTGQFYRDLSVEKKIAANAGASYSPRPYDESSFALWAYLYRPEQIDQASQSFDKIIQTLKEKGVTADELQRAKKRLKINSIKTAADLFGPANIIGNALATGRSLEDVQKWQDHIEAVTNDDIIRAANLVFQDRNKVDARILPDRP